MRMHEGAPGKPSKTEAMYIAKQKARYEDYSTFDGADRSVIALDDPDLFADIMIDQRTPGYRFIPFVRRFCYLGSIIDEKLDDAADVATRIQRASSTFGRHRKKIFCGNRLSIRSKRRLYLALVTSSALCGCESWSVTAAIERKLQSQQTQHCAQMLRARTSTQIDEKISAAKMRRIMGLENVLLEARWGAHTV
jgi:hypothetical protein